MTSYMVYKPSSVLKRHNPRHHDPTPVITMTQRPAMTRMTSETTSSFNNKTGSSTGIPEVPNPSPRPPLPAGGPSTIHLSATSTSQNARPFDHDIPDHILQAWPLVHKVHSRTRVERHPAGDVPEVSGPPTAQTRRRTRNNQGVYRSSVLTPGEMEFMARKREQRRAAALNQRQSHVTSRSCTEFYNGNRTFVTDTADAASESTALYRDQFSRMTTDSRASITPSTIEVVLPAQQNSQRNLRRTRSHQEQTLRLSGSALGTDSGDLSPRTSALLGREKTTNNHIRRNHRAGERRRRERQRQEQQFILQPTSGADFYEAQGLSTPSVLQKYLADSFYAGGANTKPEVDTTALLNYIRHKQMKNVGSCVPPPPSSGSGEGEEEEEDEEEDEDYQEVRIDASGRILPGGSDDAPLPPPPPTLTTPRRGNNMKHSVSFEDIRTDKNDHSQGRLTQGHLGSNTSTRRTIKENGCFDLMVGGDRLPWANSHVTKATGDWPVTAVSNLQIGPGNASTNTRHQAPLESNTILPAILIIPEPAPNNTPDEEHEEFVGNTLEEPPDQNRSSRDKGDNTKRITVVMPSSDASIKTDKD